MDVIIEIPLDITCHGDSVVSQHVTESQEPLTGGAVIGTDSHTQGNQIRCKLQTVWPGREFGEEIATVELSRPELSAEGVES